MNKEAGGKEGGKACREGSLERESASPHLGSKFNAIEVYLQGEAAGSNTHPLPLGVLQPGGRRRDGGRAPSPQHDHQFHLPQFVVW